MGLAQWTIAGITQAYDGSYYIYGAYHGYDDGTTNDASQRLIDRLYGFERGHTQEQGRPATRRYRSPSQALALLYSRLTNRSQTELYIHDGGGRLVWQVEWPAGAEQYTLPAGALHRGRAGGFGWLRGPQPPQPPYRGIKVPGRRP
ncbi:MAG: hypothetical protein IPL81_15100 [Flavobacteriales bacterium]|nr:hypothetical protein [Flavobacteriales bacterium]